MNPGVLLTFLFTWTTSPWLVLSTFKMATSSSLEMTICLAVKYSYKDKGLQALSSAVEFTSTFIHILYNLSFIFWLLHVSPPPPLYTSLSLYSLAFLYLSAYPLPVTSHEPQEHQSFPIQHPSAHELTKLNMLSFVLCNLEDGSLVLDS